MEIDWTKVISGAFIAAGLSVVFFGTKGANGDERLVLVKNGQFIRVLPEGMSFFLPLSSTKGIRLKVGQQGRLQANSTAIFNGIAVPVECEQAEAGMPLRLKSFSGNKLIVEPSESAT